MMMIRSKLLNLSKSNYHVINSMTISSLIISSSYDNYINNSGINKFSNKLIVMKYYSTKAFSSSSTIASSTTTTTTSNIVTNIPIASYLSHDELNCRVLNVLKSIPLVPTMTVNLHHYFITGMN